MYDLKACVVCLCTDGKLFNINSGDLRHDYNLISGLQSYRGNGLPEYLCMECCAYIKRFKKFRDKCQRSFYVFQEILHKNKEITKPALEELNCSELKLSPTLSYLDLNTCKSHFESAKFKWIKHNRSHIEPIENISILQYNTLSDDIIFEVPAKKSKHNDVEIIKEEDPACAVNDVEINGQDVSEEIVVSNENSVLDLLDSNFASDGEDFVNEEQCKTEVDNDVDGSHLDEEYANMIPISMKEAKAVVEVYKMFAQGKIQCDICGKVYHNESRLKVHQRMHDKHVSGTFFCELCSYYYKTEFLLKTHMTEKHMYKYVCRKCPEVSFDRTSAKQHYIWTHLQRGPKKDANWYDSRPTWHGAKGAKIGKNALFLRPVRKLKQLPHDFPLYSPISHEEQYMLVRDRQKTKNYIESPFKCQFCYKGFREVTTFEKHMKKHDPAHSGELQCDVCKVHCPSARKMYKHMNITHLFKYSCQMCSYVCFSRGQAKMHYRWHKNVTYSCPHCQKEFKKASTRLTHIRIKHPSTYICNLCGHSFVSETGLYCHKKLAHTKQEVEEACGAPDAQHPLYCSECRVQFRDDAAFATHFGSSIKHADTNLSINPVKMKTREYKARGRPRPNSGIVNTGLPTSTTCEICRKFLSNDVQARKHYESEHPGADFLKRYMCDICGHTTRQYANLMVHMRTHTLEKPYACPHCERRFSMPSNRDRHLVVHTGEKRYQCQHCNRRFTQSSAVKLHIQTVHLKIPYAPWDKKNRKRRKEAEATPILPPPPPKLLLEPAHDYLNAYITYNE